MRPASRYVELVRQLVTGLTLSQIYEITIGEVNRCIDRMKRLDSSIVRIMSYSIIEDENENDHEDQLFEERVKRLKDIKQI